MKRTGSQPGLMSGCKTAQFNTHEIREAGGKQCWWQLGLVAGRGVKEAGTTPQGPSGQQRGEQGAPEGTSRRLFRFPLLLRPGWSVNYRKPPALQNVPVPGGPCTFLCALQPKELTGEMRRPPPSADRSPAGTGPSTEVWRAADIPTFPPRRATS